MLTFTSTTTIEFESKEDLEQMVRVLPLPPEHIADLLEGKEVIDEEDESDATGSGAVVHTFKVTGEE